MVEVGVGVGGEGGVVISIVDAVVEEMCTLRRRVARVGPWNARRCQWSLHKETLSRAKGRGENKTKKIKRGEGNGIKRGC